MKTGLGIPFGPAEKRTRNPPSSIPKWYSPPLPSSPTGGTHLSSPPSFSRYSSLVTDAADHAPFPLVNPQQKRFPDHAYKTPTSPSPFLPFSLPGLRPQATRIARRPPRHLQAPPAEFAAAGELGQPFFFQTSSLNTVHPPDIFSCLVL
jgi:hypothetical protein